MQIDAETFILAAGRHGENAGDGDLEAGDLQERIRAVTSARRTGGEGPPAPPHAPAFIEMLDLVGRQLQMGRRAAAVLSGHSELSA